MQKHVNLVDLVKSFPTNIYLQNLASIQKRTSPVKFAHLAEKSGNGSISNVSTKAWTAVSTSSLLALVSILLAISLRPSWIPARSTHQTNNIISNQNDLSSRTCQSAQKITKCAALEPKCLCQLYGYKVTNKQILFQTPKKHHSKSAGPADGCNRLGNCSNPVRHAHTHTFESII